MALLHVDVSFTTRPEIYLYRIGSVKAMSNKRCNLPRALVVVINAKANGNSASPLPESPRPFAKSIKVKRFCLRWISLRMKNISLPPKAYLWEEKLSV
jgi:hypothetical protein